MKPITIYSLVCVLVTLAAAYWAWSGLPELDKFPVHWGADGTPDRYGSKSEVLFALLIMPASALFTAFIFMLLPKLEPIKKSVEPNARPYTMLWAMIMTLFVGIQFFIAKSYAGIADGNVQLNISVKYIIVGLSIFYLLLGNIMSKVRQNFFVGVRTPWTLSSDLSWEKTHRLTGRLMFASGLIGFICAFLLNAELALYILIGMLMAVFTAAIIYSYFVWKSDPAKRQ